MKSILFSLLENVESLGMKWFCTLTCLELLPGLAYVAIDAKYIWSDAT